MTFIHNALTGVAFALAITILALLCVPGFFEALQINAADRLPIAAGLLALCALARPYVAERAFFSLVRRYADKRGEE